MLIDFNKIDEIKMPGMNGGTGEMSARMFFCDKGKIIPTRIHPGGSIGLHKQQAMILTMSCQAGEKPSVTEKKKCFSRAAAISARKARNILLSIREVKTLFC